MKYVLAFALLLLAFGCTQIGAPNVTEDEMVKPNDVMVDKDTTMDKEDTTNDSMEKDTMVNTSDSMEKTNDTMEKDTPEQNGAMMSKASYTDYNTEAYQKAIDEGKVVYLEFYAPWCPYCVAYEPKVLAAFETMSKDSKYADVVGFKVQYDTQTDMKQKYGIVGQHTHVIVGKDGTVLVKSRETWQESDLISNIETALS